MDKFGRNFSISIASTDGSLITINPPFTIEFDIVRSNYGSANNLSIRIYNLSEITRELIRHDYLDVKYNKVITFLAGYGNNLSTAFSGSIYHAWSVREGTDFITTIEANDGADAFKNSKFDNQFPAGTSLDTIIKSMIKSLRPYGVKPGYVRRYDGQISRGNSYAGNACEILKEITGGEFFIDNGDANCLSDKEVIFDSPIVIDSEVGLLGTPIRNNLQVSFDMLFEPQIRIGQRLNLVSSTGDKDVNTLYKVIGVTHRGMISESISGNAITKVTCMPGNYLPIKLLEG